MRLVDVYSVLDSADVLYRLLAEREADQNITHHGMPSIAEHVRFIASSPYEAWYLIESRRVGVVGAIYLTRRDEIGVFLFLGYRGCRYGTRATKLLMKLHPRDRYIANINPQNERSIRMFSWLGFKHIQNTYELRP